MLPSEQWLLIKTPRRSILLAYVLLSIFCAKAARSATVTLVAPATMQVRECEAHVADPLAGEIIAPCGQPIHLSNNARVGWIETADRIVPFLADVSGGGRVLFDRLVPSGTVVFPRDRRLGANERIRLVSLVPPRDASSLRSLFVRDITSLDAKPKMPEGKAIAMLLDSKGRAIAASEPIAIRAGAESLVWPEADGKTRVIAHLKRPFATKQIDLSRIVIRAAGSDGARPPDERVDATDSLFAVWYDLPAGDIRLVTESATLPLGRDTVALSRGSVILVEETLRTLPTLTVLIGNLPNETIGQMTLTIAEATDEKKSIRSIAVAPGESHAIESLPAGPLSVDLQIDDFLLMKRVDLASGEDRQITIPLEPIRVTGTVSHGDAPAAATLRFMQRTKPLEVETDDRGSYTAILWQAQRYIIETILADHPDIPALSDMVLITTSQTLDINVPANTLHVRAIDTSDGKPLERGEIMIHSRWSDRSGSRSAVATVGLNGPLTDLPPQRIGTTEVRVRAPGYSDGGPVQILVDQSLRDRVIEIPMTRNTETASMEIVIDGVMPAAGAEIAAFTGERMTWHGAADEKGRIAVPESVTKSRVVVRHPSGASAVIFFGNRSGLDRISLLPAAPPLTVKVVGPDGARVGPSAARISIWLAGGVRLTGAEAAFATWSLAATAPDGTFTARGLRPGTIRLFATRRASDAQIQTGMFDGLATTIQFPWPSAPTARVVDE